MEAKSNEMEEDTTPEIISFNNENKLAVNYSTVGKVLNGLHTKEKVIIISILGQPKSGKSFVANWIAKYLKFNGVNDSNSWIGGDSDILEGFKWNPDLSEDIETDGNGIRTLRQPIKLTSGISILLLDIDLMKHTMITDVENNINQHQRNYNTLISVCAMISSLVIWVENGERASQQLAELDFKGPLEIALDQLYELKDVGIPRELVFVTNEYFKSNGTNNFDDIPIANSEFVCTRKLMLPNLLINKHTGYFQGEPKYIDRTKLDITIRNLLGNNELFPIWYKSNKNLKGVIDIMQKAVDIMNKSFEKAEQGLEFKLATQSPQAQIVSTHICTSESEFAIATEISSEDYFHKHDEGTAKILLPCQESKAENEKIEQPVENPSQVPDLISQVTQTSEDQLKSSHVPKTKLTKQELINLCTQEMNQYLRSNFKLFILSAHSRNCFLKELNAHIQTEFIATIQNDGCDNETIINVEIAINEHIGQLVKYFQPITNSLSISLLTIETQFDSRICFEDENELTELINTAKHSSARKFKSAGAQSQQIEKSFEECWEYITNNFMDRNKKIQQHEIENESKLVQLVLKFYNDELSSIVTANRGNNNLLYSRIAELKADAIKIMNEVFEFSRTKSNLIKLLEDRIADILNNKFGKKMIVNYENNKQLAATLPATEAATGIQTGPGSVMSYSDVTTRTGNPKTTIPKAKHSQTSTSTELSTKPGVLIMHFSRADDFKYAFIEQGTMCSKFDLNCCGSIAKAIGFQQGEYVLHKNHHPSLIDLRKFTPGEIKTFVFNNDDEGPEVAFCYEEAFGLVMAKIRTYFEAVTVDGKKTTINTCIIIIPIMTSIIERHAIHDSAKCAGFQTIHLIPETTSVAAAYLTSKKHDSNNLMVAFLSHEKVDLAVQTISINKCPYIRTESISGSLFRQLLSSLKDKLPVYGKKNDQNYFHDAMNLSSLKVDELSRIIIARDSSSTNPKLQGKEFSRISEEMDIESTLQGAIQLAKINLNKGIAWNSLFAECLPFEIVLKTVAGVQTLFKRCTALPAKEIGKIKIDKEKNISFDIIQRIGKDETILANYFVRIDGDAKWNMLEINVKLDYCGLMNVNGKLTNTKSNKNREVIMQKNYTSNIHPDKLPAIQQKITNWLKLSEDNKLRSKLLEMFGLYVVNAGPQLENLNYSMQEIFRQSVNTLNGLLSFNSKFNRQLVKEQLSLLLKIHSQHWYKVGEIELSEMNKLIW